MRGHCEAVSCPKNTKATSLLLQFVPPREEGSLILRSHECRFKDAVAVAVAEAVGLGRKGKNSRLILVAEEEEEEERSAVLAGIKCEGECPVDPGG